MEVVLLWLDDLDDLVYSAALAWERLRRLCLRLGLLSACALAGCELSLAAIQWTPTLAIVAATSVAVWLLSALLVLAQRIDAKPA
jgi:CHASE2 domain-containing sensor protein